MHIYIVETTFIFNVQQRQHPIDNLPISYLRRVNTQDSLKRINPLSHEELRVALQRGSAIESTQLTRNAQHTGLTSQQPKLNIYSRIPLIIGLYLSK